MAWKAPRADFVREDLRAAVAPVARQVVADIGVVREVEQKKLLRGGADNRVGIKPHFVDGVREEGALGVEIDDRHRSEVGGKEAANAREAALDDASGGLPESKCPG